MLAVLACLGDDIKLFPQKFQQNVTDALNRNEKPDLAKLCFNTDEQYGEIFRHFIITIRSHIIYFSFIKFFFILRYIDNKLQFHKYFVVGVGTYAQ